LRERYSRGGNLGEGKGGSGQGYGGKREGGGSEGGREGMKRVLDRGKRGGKSRKRGEELQEGTL